jgi:hypothetical protein
MQNNATPASFWTKLNGWRKSNKFRIQSFALLFSLVVPFLLYWALQTGQTALAIVFFAVLALCMLMTLWAG